jgi:hypothetical protein
MNDRQNREIIVALKLIAENVNAMVKAFNKNTEALQKMNKTVTDVGRLYKAALEEEIVEEVVTNILDEARPCGGENSNVCVAEGCYDDACLKGGKPMDDKTKNEQTAGDVHELVDDINKLQKDADRETTITQPKEGN